jgi:hypothetical protein
MWSAPNARPIYCRACWTSSRLILPGPGGGCPQSNAAPPPFSKDSLVQRWLSAVKRGGASFFQGLPGPGASVRGQARHRLVSPRTPWSRGGCPQSSAAPPRFSKDSLDQGGCPRLRAAAPHFSKDSLVQRWLSAVKRGAASFLQGLPWARRGCPQSSAAAPHFSKDFLIQGRLPAVTCGGVAARL